MSSVTMGCIVLMAINATMNDAISYVMMNLKKTFVGFVLKVLIFRLFMSIQNVDQQPGVSAAPAAMLQNSHTALPVKDGTNKLTLQIP